MPSVEVNGGNVVYEILGDSGDLVVMTPGGRFGMDVPGLRPLADAVAAGGYRVLLWDRPNCGASDVQFYGQTESHMRAETLHGLLTALDLGPCVLAGGSGGARDSMLTAMLYPELVTKLVLWNIVGGVYGMFNLGSYYVLPSLQAVRAGGPAMLPRLREWRERIAANPDNEARLLGLDREQFVKLSLRWLNAYVPRPGQTIPGVEDEMFERIQVPTLIIRGGAKDLDHPKRVSLEVGCLIEGSQVVDPPWPEDAWEQAMEDRATGKIDRYNLFDTWVLAAPTILKFLDG
ncbi:alpha/beta fold hydrolase [Nocardia bovistercoris]|uniref:Alpha/beta hydrolase n=1 Tax=Nocardia bovistercoris TaxID=2785916 RepID=A0A931IIT4_9NOCA|nr:alpha/beta hydrolase [Nocardia bovistercoris]MBH0781110.1 alpha/beta hydrolase [Nocardia bovistercoris]